MLRSRLPIAAAAAAVFGLGACSDSKGPTDTGQNAVSQAQEQLDVATFAGDQTAEDVAIFMGGGDDMGGAAAPQVGLSASPTLAAPAMSGPADLRGRLRFLRSCEYVTSGENAGRFVCPVQTFDNLTFTLSFALKDVQQQAQSLFNATTTASMNYRSTLSGTFTRNGWNAKISHKHDVTVSGLENDHTTMQRTWNGTAQVNDTASFNNGTVSRSYAVSANGTATNVVVKLPHSENPWPLSGTVTRVVQAKRTMEGGRSVSKDVSYTATVTFNGTAEVPLVVGSRQFTLNLETGRITPKD